MRTISALLGMIVLLTGCLPPSGSSEIGHGEQPASHPLAQSVSISNNLVAFGELQVVFPATVAQMNEAFGPPDRDIGDQKHILIWDSRGISAHFLIDPEVTREITVYFQSLSESHPRVAFAGSVSVDNLVISSLTTADQLKSAGFVPYGDHTCSIKSLGSTTVMAFHSDRLSHLVVTNQALR